jgi:hypothetical protein
MISTSSSFKYWGLSSSPPMITSSLTTSYIFSFSISTFVGAFYIVFFCITCVSTSSTMGIKGFAITSLSISTFSPPISLKMLEALTMLTQFFSMYIITS